MEENFRIVAGTVALTIEAGVVLILAVGTAEAMAPLRFSPREP